MARKNNLSRGAVRIIGGEHGGKRLKFVDKGGDLRPTSDRLRETLFNWLQFDLPGARVLDLFAGSGALAAEALSRGADQATVLERKRARCDDIKRQLLPLFGEQVRVACADAMAWLGQASGQWDLVFVDPPYDLGLQEGACELLQARGLLAPGALVYVESSNHETPPAVPAAWEMLREKARGDVRARLYRCNSDAEEEAAAADDRS